MSPLAAWTDTSPSPPGLVSPMSGSGMDRNRYSTTERLRRLSGKKTYAQAHQQKVQQRETSVNGSGGCVDREEERRARRSRSRSKSPGAALRRMVDESEGKSVSCDSEDVVDEFSNAIVQTTSHKSVGSTSNTHSREGTDCLAVVLAKPRCDKVAAQTKPKSKQEGSKTPPGGAASIQRSGPGSASAVPPRRSAAASAGAASAVARKRPPPRVTLSSLLGKIPQQFDRNRVSVVERMLTEIDQLPSRFSAIKVLYMSNNSVSSLEGLSQFPQLESLSLANNLVADVRQLDVLASACPSLETLMLEGNPIASSPSYRSQVVVRMPGLRALDGQEVSDQERDKAEAAVRQEQSMLDLMISNRCLLHKLEAVSRLQRLHAEIRESLFGRLSPLDPRAEGGGAAGGPLSVHRLLRLWDYEALLSPEERRGLCREVQTEAKVARHSLGSSGRPWDAAFVEVVAQQQAKAAQLMKTVERQQQEAEELWGRRQGGAGGAEALSELRRSQGAGEARIQEEREGLIREFREAAMDLMDGVVEMEEEKRRAPSLGGPTGPIAGAAQAAASRLLQGARGHHQKAAHHLRPSWTKAAGCGSDGAIMASADRRPRPTANEGEPRTRPRQLEREATRPHAAAASAASPSAAPGELRAPQQQWPKPQVPQAAAQRPVQKHQGGDMIAGAVSTEPPYERQQQGPVPMSPGPEGELPRGLQPQPHHDGNASRGGRRSGGGGSRKGEAMAALLEQVNRLQGDLESHMRGEMHLQGVNLQLRRMLEAAEQRLAESSEAQGLENSRAESDLQGLQREMAEAIRVQARLEERTRRLGEEKGLVEAAAREAAEAAVAAEAAAKEAAEERDELRAALSAAEGRLMALEADGGRCQDLLLHHQHQQGSTAQLDLHQQHQGSPLDLHHQQQQERHLELVAEVERLSVELSRAQASAEERQQQLQLAAAASEAPSRLEAIEAERDALDAQCREQRSFLSWHESRLSELQVRVEHQEAQGRLEAAVVALGSRALLRRVLRRYAEAAAASRRERFREEAADRCCRSLALERWLRAWRTAARRLKAMEAMAAARRLRLLSRSFGSLLAWLAMAKAERMSVRAATGLRGASLRRRALEAWRRHVEAFRVLLMDDVGGGGLGREGSLSVGGSSLSLSEAQHLVAEEHRRRHMASEAVEAWREWLLRHAQPRARRAACADTHRRAFLLGQGLGAFLQARKAGEEKRVRQHMADSQRRRWLWRRWQDGVAEALRERQLEVAAASLRRSLLLRGGLAAFVRALERRRAKGAAVSVADAKRRARLLGKAFGSLWEAMREGREQRLADSLTGAHLAAQQLLRDRAASALAAVRQRSQLSAALGAWRRTASLELLWRRLEVRGERVAMSLLQRRPFAAWRREAVEGRGEAVKRERGVLEAENLELRGELQQAAWDRDDAVKAAAEGERRHAELELGLEQALAESVKTEAALRAELAEARAAAREAEGSEKEQEGLEAELREAWIKVEEQGRLLRACEAALEETAAQLEAKVEAGAQERRDREELDRSLRGLVAEREQQARRLTDRLEAVQALAEEREEGMRRAEAEARDSRRRLGEAERRLGEAKRHAEEGEADVERLKSQNLELRERVTALQKGAVQAKSETRRASARAALVESQAQLRGTFQSAYDAPSASPVDHHGEHCEHSHSGDGDGDGILGGSLRDEPSFRMMSQGDRLEDRFEESERLTLVGAYPTSSGHPGATTMDDPPMRESEGFRLQGSFGGRMLGPGDASNRPPVARDLAPSHPDRSTASRDAVSADGHAESSETSGLGGFLAADRGSSGGTGMELRALANVGDGDDSLPSFVAAAPRAATATSSLWSVRPTAISLKASSADSGSDGKENQQSPEPYSGRDAPPLRLQHAGDPNDHQDAVDSRSPLGPHRREDPPPARPLWHAAAEYRRQSTPPPVSPSIVRAATDLRSEIHLLQERISSAAASSTPFSSPSPPSMRHVLREATANPQA